MINSDQSHRSRILQLARSNAVERAWSLLVESGLDRQEDDPAALTLTARLVKDRAKRTYGAERIRLLRQSADKYAQAAAIDGATYPLINAATLSFLAGDKADSEAGARAVLARLDSDPSSAETPYWREATRAEALLLLGRMDEAREAVLRGIAKAPEAWEDHAATLGQLRLLMAEMDMHPGDADWLDVLQPPRSVQFSGVMGLSADDAAAGKVVCELIDTEAPGFAYGALAAGGDILAAEAMRARGGELHIVLPCAPHLFRTHSVTCVDPAWGPRFDRMLEQAATVYCLQDTDGPSTDGIALANLVAAGLARANAVRLQSEAIRLVVTTGSPGAARRSDVGGLRMVEARIGRTADVAECTLPGNGTARSLVSCMDYTVQTATFTSAGRAWDAVSDHVAGLDYRLIDANALKDQSSEAVTILARLARDGQKLATHSFAHALLAERADIRVEPMGELRGTQGPFAFYALYTEPTGFAATNIT
ncbi:hypothetical protein HME9302_00130 [Alteripontixanthobacter maritimus]|uniref:Uncharacterized protein n=1 Tax=Alteripontixanthobacter maritimus TaxID=2161824 RepID=A0A369Q2G4_9SPHN|nr:tetratricopeptide repeat-containing protein [Alteripontixanthobacter maritimus]RDC58954.1 hypothetical protein HME9302_00130 [Alteripontixanthobacter maritimus]